MGRVVTGICGLLFGTVILAPARVQAQAGEAPPESLPPRPPPAPARYGDAGTHHIGLGLGFGVGGGGFAFSGRAAYGHFVADGVAPGVEVGYSDGTDRLGVARLMAFVRLLPLRGSSVGLLIEPRAGRLFISSHDDLWGAGGTLGIIWWVSPRAGIQLAYDYLRLMPSEDCDDLVEGCNVNGLGAGFVVGF